MGKYKYSLNDYRKALSEVEDVSKIIISEYLILMIDDANNTTANHKINKALFYLF